MPRQYIAIALIAARAVSTSTDDVCSTKDGEDEVVTLAVSVPLLVFVVEPELLPEPKNVDVAEPLTKYTFAMVCSPTKQAPVLIMSLGTGSVKLLQTPRSQSIPRLNTYTVPSSSVWNVRV